MGLVLIHGIQPDHGIGYFYVKVPIDQPSIDLYVEITAIGFNYTATPQ